MEVSKAQRLRARWWERQAQELLAEAVLDKVVLKDLASRWRWRSARSGKRGPCLWASRV